MTKIHYVCAICKQKLKDFYKSFINPSDRFDDLEYLLCRVPLTAKNHEIIRNVLLKLIPNHFKNNHGIYPSKKIPKELMVYHYKKRVKKWKHEKKMVSVILFNYEE